MRALIAAACVAVIAFVGYFFWGEWSREQAISAREQATERARAELFELAGAEGHEPGKVVLFCTTVVPNVLSREPDNATLRQVDANCANLGFRE